MVLTLEEPELLLQLEAADSAPVDVGPLLSAPAAEPVDTVPAVVRAAAVAAEGVMAAVGMVPTGPVVAVVEGDVGAETVPAATDPRSGPPTMATSSGGEVDTVCPAPDVMAEGLLVALAVVPLPAADESVGVCAPLDVLAAVEVVVGCSGDGAVLVPADAVVEVVLVTDDVDEPEESVAELPEALVGAWVADAESVVVVDDDVVSVPFEVVVDASEMEKNS